MTQVGRAVIQDDEEFFAKKALEMREINLQELSEQMAKGEQIIKEEMGELQKKKIRLFTKMSQDTDPERRAKGIALLQEIGHS